MANRTSDIEKMLKTILGECHVDDYTFSTLRKHKAVDFICRDGRKRRVVYSTSCSDSRRAIQEIKQDLRKQLREGGNLT